MIELLKLLPLFLVAFVVHEFAHAWTAVKLGDTLPAEQGRVSLKPLRHLEIWGSVVVPLASLVLTWGHLMFAFAKPVMFRPEACRNPRLAVGVVGVAGPAANLALAMVSMLSVGLDWVGDGASDIVIQFGVVNAFLAVFNMIPVPPLDGSRVVAALLPERARERYLGNELATLGIAAVLVIGADVVLDFDFLELLFDGAVFPLLEAVMALVSS